MGAAAYMLRIQLVCCAFVLNFEETVARDIAGWLSSSWRSVSGARRSFEGLCIVVGNIFIRIKIECWRRGVIVGSCM